MHFKNDASQYPLAVASIETIFCLFSQFYKNIISEQYLLLDLHIYSSSQIINEVEQQNIDIGFVARERISRNVVIEPIFHERHYLVGNLGSGKKVIDPRTLDPRKELFTDWGTTFRAWHESYFDIHNHPLAAIDTASSILNLLTDGVWCIVPASAVRFLQAGCAIYGNNVQVYEIPDPPPDRICYKVINHSPRTNRIENIRYFERMLDKYLKENDLHF